ncbi:hypothetical protein [Chitinophaga flava]|uniref:Uncharacterized protein n=1 Tax=Chitinophaga flava TaxID=2259036 RepID=A0A365XW05_9BACT|nr:hypothetical protein [Chitinophaga flava]RBL90513.1 hypothetical protein DF182_29085 [Chitinophaga flava]
MNNIKTLLILLPVVAGIGLITVIPWWGFTIPVMVTGMIVTLKKWKIASFPIGFLAGFIAWLGAGVYFHTVYQGNIINRFATHSDIIILLVIALTGGLLTGLALYAGKSLVYRKS